MQLSKRALKVIIAVSGVSLLVRLLQALATFLPLLAAMAMTSKEASSIGIIGGADGPTAIYVASKFMPPLDWLFRLCSLAEIILYVFLVVKSVKALRAGGK